MPTEIESVQRPTVMHGAYLCTVNDQDGCGEVLHFWAQLQPNGKHRAMVYMERSAGVFGECEEMGDLNDDGEEFVFEGDPEGCLGFIGVFYWGEYQDPRFTGMQAS